MPATAKPKVVQTAASVPKQNTVPRARPRSARPKPRPQRPLLPLVIIGAVLATHLSATAMLNWETARRESLRREIDRVRLNIEKLRGQLAVYTDEVAVRRWAERAGMVRVDTQPELTVVGFEAPTLPTQPLAMHMRE